MEVCSLLRIKMIKLNNSVSLWEKILHIFNHQCASLFLLAAYNHGSTAKQAIYMDGSSSLNSLSSFFLFALSCFAAFHIPRLLLFNLLREKQQKINLLTRLTSNCSEFVRKPQVYIRHQMGRYSKCINASAALLKLNSCINRHAIGRL